MLEKLWKDIELIYENCFKKETGYLDNLIILSQDNYYRLHYVVDSGSNVNIRIEKDYNLVRIWGGDVPYDMVNYKIYVEVGEQVYSQENSKIDLTYKIITPFLRETKLDKIGI